MLRGSSGSARQGSWRPLPFGKAQDRDSRAIRAGAHLAAELVGGGQQLAQRRRERPTPFRRQRQLGGPTEMVDRLRGDGLLAIHAVLPRRAAAARERSG